MLASAQCSDRIIRQCSVSMWAIGLLLAAVQPLDAAVLLSAALPAGHGRSSGRALLDTSLALQHAAGSATKQAVRPEVAMCSSHMKELVARLERHYTGVQLDNALVSFCITSQEFNSAGNLPSASRLDDGFESREKCERYAQQLVAARDAEAEGEKGGYTDFCRSYHHVEEKIMPRVIIPEPKIAGLPEKRSSVWMLVGAGLLFSLLIAACLFCLAGALTRRRAPPKAPVVKDWLTVARELFEKYDIHRNGLLEKKEFAKLLDDLADHVCREYERSGEHYSQAEIHRTLKRELDTDFDGTVSKQEFMQNVKAIVDDIL